MGVVALLVLSFPLSAPGMSRNPGAGNAVLRSAAGGSCHPTTSWTNVTRTYHGPDGFSLSYDELLPAGFSNASTYPLAVYLHGIAINEWKPQSGGYPASPPCTVENNGTANGFVVIAPWTRTGTGSYVNSTFTGPQQGDIWNAITSEQSWHKIGKVYLIGSSSGTFGVFILSLNHPKAFAGIGAFSSFSDYFEEYDYNNRTGGAHQTAMAMLNLSGGLTPASSAYAKALFYQESVTRFFPQNFSGIPTYISHGGNDVASPNNPAFWNYEQANNSVLNQTCNVRTDINEPAQCTNPLLALETISPKSYDIRYLYNSTGAHGVSEINGKDLFAFFLGKVGTGVYWVDALGNPIPAPTPVVNFATQPNQCGKIRFGSTNFTYGTFTMAGTSGTHNLRAGGCSGHPTVVITVLGNATYNATAHAVTVTGNASILATFSEPARPTPRRARPPAE
jgi:pimeloyl-ACP methyl ester carboxylesterase